MNYGCYLLSLGKMKPCCNLEDKLVLRASHIFPFKSLCLVYLQEYHRRSSPITSCSSKAGCGSPNKFQLYSSFTPKATSSAIPTHWRKGKSSGSSAISQTTLTVALVTRAHKSLHPCVGKHSKKNILLSTEQSSWATAHQEEQRAFCLA